MKLKLIMSLALSVLAIALGAQPANAWYYYPSTYTTPVASCYPIEQWYGPGNVSHYPGAVPDDEKAVDIGAPYGTPVYATQDGWIYFEGWQTKSDGSPGAGGIMIRLRDNAGLETVYAHLSQTIVDQWQLVAKNQLIGYSGASGYGNLHYWPEHLHWAIRVADGPALEPDNIPGVQGPPYPGYWPYDGRFHVCA
jgi:murein DD-endopeptidase MepM/ murein hydrolase activator NlpD